VAGKGVTVNAVAPALVTGTGMMGEEGGEVARRMAGSELISVLGAGPA